MSLVFAASLSGVIVEGYTGPIVELRANVSSSLQDFTYVGGVLVTDDVNQDTVADWLASESSTIPLIRTLYNQAGGTDAIQTSNSAQPRLVEDINESGKWAAQFDGDDFLSVADHAAIDITDKLSLSCWFMRDSASQNASLFSKRNAGATNLAYQLNIINSGTADVLRFAARDGSGVYTLDSTGGLVENTNWHFCAFAIDTDEDDYAHNIDGSTAGSGTTTRALVADNEVLRIGNDHSSSFLTGRMDDIRIHNEYITDWSGPSSQRGWIAAGEAAVGRTRTLMGVGV